MNWVEILGWGGEEQEDLRFVGYTYVKQGKYEVAKSFFEALILINPQNSYDLETLGAIYLEMGKNSEALQTLEKALQIDPTHAPALLNRAKALFALGRVDQGLQIAKSLENHLEAQVADQAVALTLAYS